MFLWSTGTRNILYETKKMWLGLTKVLCFKMKHCFTTVTYKVTVVTGDEFGAGTDANVAITVSGRNGSSAKQPLKRKGVNLFERNQSDVFHLNLEDLGIQFLYRARKRYQYCVNLILKSKYL